MALCYDTNASTNHAHDHRRPSGPELEHTISKLPATMPPGTALELTNSKPVMLTDFSTYTISVGQFGPTDQPRKLIILGSCRTSTEGFFMIPSLVSNILPRDYSTGHVHRSTMLYSRRTGDCKSNPSSTLD